MTIDSITTESFIANFSRSHDRGHGAVANVASLLRLQGNVPKILNMSRFFAYYLSKFLGMKNPFTYKPKNEGGMPKLFSNFHIFFYLLYDFVLLRLNRGPC